MVNQLDKKKWKYGVSFCVRKHNFSIDLSQWMVMCILYVIIKTLTVQKIQIIKILWVDNIVFWHKNRPKTRLVEAIN